MKKIILMHACCLLPFVLLGQHSSEERKEAMKNLTFLAGQWEGEGWIMNREGNKNTFTQTEDIQWKMDGELLLIEGLGKSYDEALQEERVIHNALATVTYNTQTGNYDFQSYVAGRGSGTAVGKLLDEKTFQWELSAPHGKIRYTITINKEGQWYEVGEYSPDGQVWNQFFEMTLTKEST